jgi:hypothetical protein
MALIRRGSEVSGVCAVANETVLLSVVCVI